MNDNIELPDCKFLIHASKSLKLLISNNNDNSIILKAKKYQNYFISICDMEWEDL